MTKKGLRDKGLRAKGNEKPASGGSAQRHHTTETEVDAAIVGVGVVAAGAPHRRAGKGEISRFTSGTRFRRAKGVLIRPACRFPNPG